MTHPNLSHVNIVARIIIFGALSGLMWSVIPGFLGDLFNTPAETLTVFITGMITGILDSFTLWRPLQRLSKRKSILFGILALPFGAFCFGVLIQIVHLVAGYITGLGESFAHHKFTPFSTGIWYAVFSLISIYTIAFLPLAIFTTLFLRTVILKKGAT